MLIHGAIKPTPSLRTAPSAADAEARAVSQQLVPSVRQKVPPDDEVRLLLKLGHGRQGLLTVRRTLSRQGQPSAEFIGNAVTVVGAVGAIFGGASGAAILCSRGAGLANRNTRVLRRRSWLGEQNESPRCKTKRTCLVAHGAGLGLVCQGNAAKKIF